MKKLFPVAVLGLVGLGLATETASAGWWGNWCCNRHSPKLCCRQYNAFSPYCCEPLPSGYLWNNDHEGVADGDCCTDGSVVVGSRPAAPQATASNIRPTPPPNAATVQLPSAPPRAAIPQRGPLNYPAPISQGPIYPGFQGAMPGYNAPGYGWGNAPYGGR